MPREDPCRKDVLERLRTKADEIYPCKMVFNKKEVSALTGIPYSTLTKSKKFRWRTDNTITLAALSFGLVI